MKIRTDFVTNSSSSSFIFKENNPEQIRKAIEDRASMPPENRWEAQTYEWIKELAPYIIGKKFEEYKIEILMEVLKKQAEETIDTYIEKLQSGEIKLRKVMLHYWFVEKKESDITGEEYLQAHGIVRCNVY